MNALSLYTPDYDNDSHSPWSPSSANAWLKCPLYPLVNWESQQAESGAAAAGTLLHEEAADALTSGGRCYSEELGTYIRFCRSLMEGEAVTGVETHLHLENIRSIFGTADFQSRTRRVLHVVDLKTGRVQVEAKDNSQGKLYLLGLWDGEEILRFTIVQQDSIRTVEYTYSELALWFKNTVYPAYIASLVTLPKPNPSVETCKWCADKGRCIGYSGLMNQEASLAFAPVAPKPETMTPDQIAQIVKMAPAVTAWLKAVEQAGKQLVEEGFGLPGFKMVAGRKSRAWADDNAALDFAVKHGVDPYVKKFMSPAQLEKVMKPHKKAIQEFVVTQPGKPTLVGVEDKRPALATAASLVFKGFEA